MFETLGMLGQFASGLGSLIGGASGLFGGSSSSKVAKDLLGRQMDRQEIWMKNQMRWRVDDAKAAGIHPLAAIGSNVTAPSVPGVAVGDTGSNVGSSLAEMGQGIGRAASAFMTSADKDAAAMRSLEIEGAQIDNQIKLESLKKLRSVGSPPDFPDVLGPTNRPYPPNSPIQIQSLPPAAAAAGMIDPKPSTAISPAPGRPGIEAGVNPESRWMRTETGAIDRMPSEAWQMDDMGSPGYLTWQLRNSILPSAPFGARALPPPPKKYEVPGQVGWFYKIGHGYVPVFKGDTASQYSPWFVPLSPN